MFTKLILALTATVLGALDVSSAALAADGETRTLTNNAFHEYASSTCDASAFTCNLTFPPTTYATTLIKAVSCEIHASLGANLGFKFGTVTGYEAFFLPGSIFVAGGDLDVTTNASTYLFIDKGETPAFVATVLNGTFTVGTTLFCTISGEHS